MRLCLLRAEGLERWGIPLLRSSRATPRRRGVMVRLRSYKLSTRLRRRSWGSGIGANKYKQGDQLPLDLLQVDDRY